MTMTDQLTIEEILLEAGAYCLRNEVANLAHEFKYWDGHSDIEAHKLAFDTLILTQ
jgi:hypothetical protein